MALLLQRLGVLLITAASIALALSGRSAMELVEDAYAMSLVGMFVPFVIGIYAKQVSSRAAIASMLVGIASWLVHVVQGWEGFAEPWSPIPIPHELIDTTLSALAFAWFSMTSPRI